MKGVQCYELFGGIALKIHTFSIFFHFLYHYCFHLSAFRFFLPKMNFGSSILHIVVEPAASSGIKRQGFPRTIVSWNILPLDVNKYRHWNSFNMRYPKSLCYQFCIADMGLLNIILCLHRFFFLSAFCRIVCAEGSTLKLSILNFGKKNGKQYPRFIVHKCSIPCPECCHHS